MTNPPIDPLREGLVMSMEMRLGGRGNLLEPGPNTYQQVQLKSPVLLESELQAIQNDKVGGRVWGGVRDGGGLSRPNGDGYGQEQGEGSSCGHRKIALAVRYEPELVQQENLVCYERSSAMALLHTLPPGSSIHHPEHPVRCSQSAASGAGHQDVQD